MSIIATNQAQFISYFVYFILISIIAFYIPGRVMLKRAKTLSSSESFILSFAAGISLFSLSEYILGYLNFRVGIYALLMLAFFLWIKNIKKEKQIISEGLFFFAKDKVLILLTLVGIPVVLMSVFTSGLITKEGVGFYGINPIDGNYHIGLIRSIIQSFPPEEPGMAGALVKNYHYFSDLTLAGMVRIFRIPVFNIFYHYFPLLLAILYSFAGYRLVLTLKLNKNTARFFVFLLFFAGNLGYLFMYYHTGIFDFTLTSLDNGALLFTNPPRILAQFLFLSGSISLYKWIKTKEPVYGFCTATVFGVCVGFKVYVGIYAGIIMGILFLYYLQKKDYKFLWPTLLTALISFMIYYPANKDAGGLIFAPFSWPRHFFSQGASTQLMWHLALDEFKVHNNYLRIYLMYLQMTLFFLIITLGTRSLFVFGIISFFKKVNKIFAYAFIAPAFLFVLITVFFLQASGLYEIFNFLAVAALPFSLLSALFLSDLFGATINSKSLKIKIFTGVVLVTIIALTAPRTIKESYWYYNLFTQKSGFLVSWSDLEDYNKISKLDFEGLLLTDNNDQLGNYSPYLYAFIGQRMYLSGAGILRAHGLDPSEKEKAKQLLFSEGDELEFTRRAKQFGISHIYLLKPTNGIIELGKYKEVVVENDKFILLKI
jgi:hypothetical protein